VPLVLDQNLSFRLIALLSDIFPGARHVRTVGLASADDESVWAYAETHRFATVSKDGDFHQRSLLLGAPPKVVWLRLGNCTTSEIEDVLRRRNAEIIEFIGDDEASLLVIDG
jgi:predicted nuclease of predicted toxin-antitoxin system